MEDGAHENVVPVEVPAVKKEAAAATGGGGSWGGWGGWGTSALSVFTDLQKAAAEVADEISKNAVAAAQGAAKGVTELQKSVVDQIDSDVVKEASLPKEEAVPVEKGEKVNNDEEEDIPLTPQDKLRRNALDKLEGASKDSFLGQGLKAFDESVENIASGAFQAIGNAWKGSLTLVQKLEHSAENLAGTIQQGALTQKAGSFVESSKAFTARGIKVLEHVGKETLDMIAAETGIELEKDPPASGIDGEEVYNEDVTFDRCFYIYGGPEHLEELESLSNHYTLLCNRARAKLSGESKTTYDGTLKQLHQTLTLSGENDDGSNKGKKVDAESAKSGDELTSLRDSSISKAAEMAAGFTGALGGLAVKEVVKKTNDRLDAIKAEGVHRLSELCAVCISHLVVLGKSVLASSSEGGDKTNSTAEEVEWPQDTLGKAALFRVRARAMSGDIEAVSDSFITGIGDVTAAFQAAIKNELAAAKEEGVEGIREGLQKESSIDDKAQAVCSDIETDGSLAIEKIQDGLKHLVYVVLSTSFNS